MLPSSAQLGMFESDDKTDSAQLWRDRDEWNQYVMHPVLMLPHAAPTRPNSCLFDPDLPLMFPNVRSARPHLERFRSLLQIPMSFLE